MDGWKSLPRLENEHDRIVPAVLFGQARHIRKPKFGETELTATGDAGVSVPHLVELVSDDH
jgi:hypothetical protein